jgi:maleylacetoacetate isomerase
MRPVLYHNERSSSSGRVRFALALKGIEVDFVSIDLRGGQQWTEEHLKRNPMGYVPALELDGRCLGESVAIIEYLDERYPDPPLYPRDLWTRARVRQLVELVASGVQPMQNLFVLQRLSQDADERKAWARHFNERGMNAYERLLERLAGEGLAGRFSVGDALTAADVFLLPQVAAARRFGVDVDQLPRVSAVERALLATPHAATALPPPHLKP